MGDKVRVNVEPLGIGLVANRGTPLLGALLRAGIALQTACGGQGTCGKCRVRVHGSSESLPTEKEWLHLSVSDISMGMRLACQMVLSDDVNIELPSGSEVGEICSDQVESSGGTPSFTELVVAVDIGTTTIKLEVIGLPAGKAIASRSTLNPQRAFGHDVMSRIAAADNPDQARVMTSILRDAVTMLIMQSLARLGAVARDISRIVISGNTVMLHFFFGMNVHCLGKYPYTPQSLDAIIGNATKYGLAVFDRAAIFGLPAVSAYLGGDLVAGLFATGIHKTTGNSIFIDIGTNSEIIFVGAKGMMATSCAAGPALEGMNITYGLTASPGAISGVAIDKEVKLTVLGGHPKPLGFCGSGIIELLAELLRVGLVDASGRLQPSNASVPASISKEMRNHEDSLAFFVNDNVCFTQKDVRQVQLAKGALLSGLIALRNLVGVSPDDIGSVVIAGEFGRHLKAKHLLRLGMIEDLPNATYSFVGNSSLKGAGMIAVNPLLLKDAAALASRVMAFPLATLSSYQRLFLQSLEFPANVQER